jgi:hypothetical protein
VSKKNNVDTTRSKPPLKTTIIRHATYVTVHARRTGWKYVGHSVPQGRGRGKAAGGCDGHHHILPLETIHYLSTFFPLTCYQLRVRHSFSNFVWCVCVRGWGPLTAGRRIWLHPRGVSPQEACFSRLVHRRHHRRRPRWGIRTIKSVSWFLAPAPKKS